MVFIDNLDLFLQGHSEMATVWVLIGVIFMQSIDKLPVVYWNSGGLCSA